MRVDLHRRHIIILLSAIILLGLIYLGGYVFYLKPLKDEINDTKSSNALLQEQIDEPSKENENKTNSFTLLQKVPVDSLIDQLVLDLEKAEIISNSTIQSIEFSEGEVVLTERDEAGANDEEESVEDEGNIDLEEAAEESEKVIDISGAPEGLEQLSIQLKVTAVDFYGMKKFVEVIENQTRIIMINQLIFDGPPEVTLLTDTVNPLDFEVHLAAFYLPTLTDLQADEPTIQPPASSEKTNPFFPSFSE